MRFGETQLPRKSRVVDGASRSGSRAAVVSRDQDDLRACLRDACRDGADARFTDELDGDARLFVGVFEVINELRQVLDRINIVVGRRRNQRYAGGGVPCLGDPRIDLVAGQMTALAGLCALRHLDLDFVRRIEVCRGHAEASRGDLLDRGTAVFLRSLCRDTLGAFSALAGVRLAAESVHRDRERFMRLLRNGTVAHGAALEAAYDAVDALDLVKRHGRLGVVEIEQSAHADGIHLLGQHLAVFLVSVVIIEARRGLQRVNCLRVVEVLLLTAAALVTAA